MSIRFTDFLAELPLAERDAAHARYLKLMAEEAAFRLVPQTTSHLTPQTTKAAPPVTLGEAASVVIERLRNSREDAEDIAAAGIAMAEEGSIPWEQVKGELGL